MKKIISLVMAIFLAVNISVSAYAVTPIGYNPQTDTYSSWFAQVQDWIDAACSYAGAWATGADYDQLYTAARYLTIDGAADGNGRYHYGNSGAQTAGTTYSYLYNGGDNYDINDGRTYNTYKVFNSYYDNRARNYNYQWYNPVTNNYQTINNTSVTENRTNIEYSPTYNTYHITQNEYNTYNKYETYITNNNTYISYYIIDPIEELSWYYEIYYLLPDGRNSYDLEAKDVWGQYFFYDAVNYQEVAEDDGTTLALLHFDGNLLDSSSHNCNVTYETGANYNFAESDFTGALYWKDGVEHKLNITLPENLDGDFTIEGRLSVSGENDYKYQNFHDGDWYDVEIVHHHPPDNTDTRGYVRFDTVENAESAISSCISQMGIFDASTIQWANNGDNHPMYYISQMNLLYPLRKISDSIVSVSGENVLYSSPVYNFNNYSTSYDGTVRFFHSPASPSLPWLFQNTCLTYKLIDKYCSPQVISSFDFSSSTTFALCRSGSTLHYFVNGLEVYSCECSRDLGNVVTLSGGEKTVALFDELRVSNKALYTDTYTPSAQPFDTNLVLVVPESGSETSIAIKSNVPVGNLRVGGVRPTYPGNGDVYVYLENDVVRDVQQYQVDGWYSVTASIYEDGAWTPFNGKNVSNYVVYEPDPDSPDPTPTPTPGPGGTSTPETPGGGGTGGDDDDGGIWDFLSDLFGGLIDMLASLVGGAVKMLAGVLGGLVDLFKSLLSFVSGFTDFLTATIGFLPVEMLQALSAGIILMVIIAIIKFIGGFL